MKTANLLRTISANGARRWFINGKRVTCEAYAIACFHVRLDCLQTITKGGITRHYATATKTA